MKPAQVPGWNRSEPTAEDANGRCQVRAVPTICLVPVPSCLAIRACRFGRGRFRVGHSGAATIREPGCSGLRAKRGDVRRCGAARVANSRSPRDPRRRGIAI